MAAPVFNVTARKVGGIRFLKIGRINISFSVSRQKTKRAPVIKAFALVELAEDGFVPTVGLIKDGKATGRYVRGPVMPTAGDAMFHARAAVASCGLALAR